MEKENCECNSFQNKGYSPQIIMKKFYILAATKSDNPSSPKDGGFTSLLKCPDCGSYYLVNLHDSDYPNQDTISIEKYKPKIEEKELKKVINRLEGILSPIEIDAVSIAKSVLNEDKTNKELNDSQN